MAAVLIAVSASLWGRQIWVVQFQTQFPFEPPLCDAFYAWQSRLLLTNTTDLPQTVRLMSVSNGPVRADARDLTLAPHHTTEILGDSPTDPHWAPDASRSVAPIWVDQLEVPDGVVVSDRGEVFINQPAAGSTSPPCEFEASVSGGLSLQVVNALVPGGTSQYHLGTDVGDAAITGTPRIDARINVGVYNAGTVPALATVQIRCSDSVAAPEVANDVDPLIMTVQIAVPPNSVVQKTVLPSMVEAAPCKYGFPSPYHVIVTSDQPGFSYAAALKNGSLPLFVGYSPVTF